MSTLPPELLREVAKISDPKTARKIKCLNRFLKNLITNTDLQLGETRWRLGKYPAGECLFWAVRNELSKIVSDMLSSFEVPIGNLQITQREKDTALVWAAGLGFAEIVALLLMHKADVNAARNADTARSISATIRYHMGRVGPIEVKNGVYPLTVAAFSGHVNVVTLLLEAGAQINADEGGALCFAAENGHHSVVSVLLKSGARIRREALAFIFIWAPLGCHAFAGSWRGCPRK